MKLCNGGKDSTTNLFGEANDNSVFSREWGFTLSWKWTRTGEWLEEIRNTACVPSFNHNTFQPATGPHVKVNERRYLITNFDNDAVAWQLAKLKFAEINLQKNVYIIYTCNSSMENDISCKRISVYTFDIGMYVYFRWQRQKSKEQTRHVFKLSAICPFCFVAFGIIMISFWWSSDTHRIVPSSPHLDGTRQQPMMKAWSKIQFESPTQCCCYPLQCSPLGGQTHKKETTRKILSWQCDALPLRSWDRVDSLETSRVAVCNHINRSLFIATYILLAAVISVVLSNAIHAVPSPGSVPI